MGDSLYSGCSDIFPISGEPWICEHTVSAISVAIIRLITYLTIYFHWPHSRSWIPALGPISLWRATRYRNRGCGLLQPPFGLLIEILSSTSHRSSLCMQRTEVQICSHLGEPVVNDVSSSTRIASITVVYITTWMLRILVGHDSDFTWNSVNVRVPISTTESLRPG